MNKTASALETARIAEEKKDAKRWRPIEKELSLADALARLTASELSAIRVNTGIQGASGLKKQELIDVLSLRLPEMLPHILQVFDKARFHVLKRVVVQGGCAHLQLEEQQLRYFAERGLLATGTYAGKKTLVMPREVIGAFRQADSERIRAVMQRNETWLKLTQGLLYYYGTLSLEELDTLMDRHKEETADTPDYRTVVGDALLYHSEMVETDAGLSHFRVPDAVKVKNEHNVRSAIPFQPFTKQQLLLAGENGFMDRGPSYRAFADFIRKRYSIDRTVADRLVETCVYAIRAGEPLSRLLSYLSRRLEMKNDSLIRSFMDHLVLLHNHTRQWELKGYSPEELTNVSGDGGQAARRTGAGR